MKKSMLKKIVYMLFLSVVIFHIPGCSNFNKTNVGSKEETENEQINKPGNNDNKDLTNDNKGLTNENSSIPQDSKGEQNLDETTKKINDMSIEEKVGQMVFIGVEGHAINENATELIGKYKVGGVILLGENIESTTQALGFINSLKELNRTKGNIPLFLGVDQEGGRVNRMPKDFIKIPASKEIGKINNKTFSYDIGKALGTQVKSLGFNLDFAPVLDIYSNPKNQVIGDRAFGTTANIVSSLGIQTMKGISSQGIIPVIKHFPGHGDTSVDSHTGLPVENIDVKRLKDLETVPFGNAIKDGAEMVMVAHILFPKIDPDNPASLSKNIITYLLKKDLKFRGLVVTDDMTMGAISNKYDIGEAAVKSVNAGSDIILVCHDYNKEKAVLDALITAVKKGVIQEEVIDKSVYKIIKLKEKYIIKDESTPKPDVNKINSGITSILNKYMK